MAAARVDPPGASGAEERGEIGDNIGPSD